MQKAQACGPGLVIGMRYDVKSEFVGKYCVAGQADVAQYVIIHLEQGLADDAAVFSLEHAVEHVFKKVAVLVGGILKQD